jgi:tetratricopeptide (TPR) repeat protein
MEIDLDEAEFWIEKALISQPEAAEVHYTLGIIRGYQAQNAIFSALSLAKKSKHAFEKAVALAPRSVKYQRGLLSFYLSAPSLAGGSLEEAAAIANKIEKLNLFEGLLARIDIARATEDAMEERGLFERGLKEFESSAKLNYLAGMFYQKVEDYEKAFELFENAILAADAQDSITRFAAAYQVGRTAVFSELQTERGIEALLDYISNAPNHKDLVEKHWAEFRLALLFERAGQTKKAHSIYARLIETKDKSLKKEVKKRI